MDFDEQRNRSLKLDEEIRNQKRYCLIFFTFGCLCMMTILVIAGSSLENPAFRFVMIVPMLGPMLSFPFILRKADWRRSQTDYITTGQLDRRRWTLGKMLFAMCTVLAITVGGSIFISRMNHIRYERDRLHQRSIESRRRPLEGVVRDDGHDSSPIPIVISKARANAK